MTYRTASSLLAVMLFGVTGALAGCLNPPDGQLAYCTGLPMGLFQTLFFDRYTHHPTTEVLLTEIFMDGSFRETDS
jgi:hypothetical protein